MANEKKFVKAITSRDDDFAQWYTDVVREAQLCDYSSVKGCLNYLPNGYAIWERIQADLDARFKATGVENVYLPTLIPENLLQKESDHIEGFAPEVAWVTHGGMEKLQERLCIRPTSETLFCDLWSRMVSSHRDLPKVWNQWCTVLRWEKTTRPFLRSREFLWQEGHTIHATYEEAEQRTLTMLNAYQECYKECMAIPFVSGRKAEHEKFAGAQDTYTVEALMHDGKALQSATSHFFGKSFPDAFDIKYMDKNNQLASVYETSWGLSTRSIGAIIMVHGDDSGLVLPPHVAPVECRIIPIAQHKEGVLDRADALLNELKAAGYRMSIDTSDKSPGWKFSEQEMVGIPTRIEIGPKDIENNQVVVVRRDTREKIVVSLDEISTKLRDILETVQEDMYNRAEEFLDSHIDTAVTLDEMEEKFKENRGFVKACWCGDPACEDEIKTATGGAATRCLIEDEAMISDTCIYCGKPAKHMAYWGKSY
ncbi:MAG: proline--tRNA ligase [Eubacteriales bacterium]